MFVEHPSGQIGIGQVKEHTFPYGFFTVAYIQQTGIELFQLLFILIQKFIVKLAPVAPAAYAVHAPVIENSGSSPK